MNDFDPTLDEIVSAYVDGAATPDERARVEADPALVARAATFRSIHTALAAPDVPADDDLRQALITRALAQTAAIGATVHPLRNRRATALGPIVAAAAVIAMLLGLGTLLVGSQDGGDSDSASTAAATDSFDAQDKLGAPAAGATAGAGLGVRPAPTAEAAKGTPFYLGGFANEIDLRQAVAVARDQTATSAATTSPSRAAATTGDTAQCGRTDPPGATIYSADLRGRPVTVVVTQTRADLFDNATCVGPLDLLSLQPPLTFGDPRPTTTTR